MCVGCFERRRIHCLIYEQGFKNVQIKKRKKIEIPENVLKEFLDEKGLKDYKENIQGIFSITVTGEK